MQKQTDGCNLAYDQKAQKKQPQKKFFNNIFFIRIPSRFLLHTLYIPQSSNMIAIY